MLQHLVLVCMMALSLFFAGCDGRRPPLTDFDQGFNAGIVAVREARKEWGILGDAAAMVGQIGPADKHKSADWNAGFRAGINADYSSRGQE
ncbi:MAG: hypothetical protein K2X38_24040 [Gemmataceae bacterium]|nr:hypothetical protein [Gemmataceae bacterium]